MMQDVLAVVLAMLPCLYMHLTGNEWLCQPRCCTVRGTLLKAVDDTVQRAVSDAVRKIVQIRA
eukprot:1160529-Pelagomonas_calceolata.AAC.8